VSGSLIWSNNNGGVFSSGGSGNRIGGSTPAARNVISANGGSGVHLQANTNSVIAGNFIGTDVPGTAALGGGNGVFLDGGSNNLVGLPGGGVSLFFGNPAVMRNVISGNAGAGIVFGNLFGVPVGHRILGNLIGTDVTGTFGVTNQFNGITVSGAVGTTIGGTNENEPNLIAFNLGQAIQVLLNSATNNNIQANSMFDNTGLGIDLAGGGVTANDPGDPDSGPNRQQNFPALTNAAITETNLIAQGTLNSRPSATYRLDFYANVACDPSGNGEGKHWLGSTTVTTGADSNATFSVNLPLPPEGQWITATATDLSGNTSEYCACRQVVSLIPPVTYVVTNLNDSGPGSLRQAILDNNASFHSGPNRIEFNIAGAGVKTISPLTPLPEITRPVIIDGFTQPGASANTATNGNNAVWLIRLDGTSAVSTDTVDALNFVNTTSNVVRGLCIVNFTSDGIQLNGGGSSLIEENLLGIDLLAQSPAPFNLRDGVESDESPNNRIRNNIIGFVRRGIFVDGFSGVNNDLDGNLIGKTPAGNPAPTIVTGVNIRNAPGTKIHGGGIFNSAGNGVTAIPSTVLMTLDLPAFGPVGGILNDRGNDGSSGPTIPTVPLPQLTSVTTSGGLTTVQGGFLGATNHLYTLIIYAKFTNQYVRYFETNVMTGSGGLASINFAMPALPPGTFLRATAANSAGTSEDTPDFVVMPAGTPGNSDLGITKTDSMDPVALGTNFTYTITVTNGGPLPATNVIVRDFVPTFMLVFGGTTTHGQLAAGNPLSVFIPVLTNGEVAVISLTAVSFFFTNVYSNAVTVASSMIDPNPANNTDSELTTILHPNDPAFGFRITRITTTSGVSAVIEWNSVAGKTYRVQYKNSLSAPAWSDLPGDVTATTNTASKVDTTIAGVTQRFYRVALVTAPSPPPLLSIVRTNNQLMVSWPSSTPVGFTLETTANLTPIIVWTMVTNVPSDNGTNKTVNLNISPVEPTRLYRLRQ